MTIFSSGFRQIGDVKKNTVNLVEKQFGQTQIGYQDIIIKINDSFFIVSGFIYFFKNPFSVSI